MLYNYACTSITCFLYLPYRSDVGSEVGFEATGKIDGKLPTVGIFARNSSEVCLVVWLCQYQIFVTFCFDLGSRKTY